MDQIKALRREINNILDQLEKKTVEQLDSMVNNLEKSVKDDIETCTQMYDQLKTMMEQVRQMSGNHKETNSYIGYKRCQSQMTKGNSVIQEIEARPKERVLLLPKIQIETFLNEMDNLGNTDKVHVYSYHSLKSVYVKIKCDKCNCYIDSVCEMLNGDIVIADCNNKRVKLLNSQYQVIDHCDLPGPPQHFCHTVGNEIAVAARKEVHFLKVTSGRLQKVRKFSTDHDCFSIADFKDELYVGSKTALYWYTMNGELVEKIYQDKYGDSTVYSCAVSPDGERIYVTNYSAHRLLTLDKSGQVLFTFEDPELKCPTGVCVSPSIHVFVCGQESHTVLQVDREGTQKLATVVRKADGLLRPPSVCFIEKTSSLLVGSYDSIIVFKLC
ncbi:uncharacterized protein LOC128234593 [Mya arenaria]|uniref:uncharacterized protein LOC128234593 n=1 Tax=Mya arenaria TaxID=6604 RepID=UPI0022E926EC|nr:uncharacterized protein LOC128234593 [Mya arenaria]